MARKKKKNGITYLMQYKHKYPELANELEVAMHNKLPEDWDENLPRYEAGKDKLATRVASGDAINTFAKTIPNLFGGSADLASSNNTMMKEEAILQKRAMMVEISGLVFVNLQWVQH